MGIPESKSIITVPPFYSFLHCTLLLHVIHDSFKKIWKVKQVIKAFWILVLIQMISKVSYPFKINAYKTTTIPILYKIIYCKNKSWRQSEYYTYIFVVTFLRKTNSLPHTSDAPFWGRPEAKYSPPVTTFCIFCHQHVIVPERTIQLL